MSDVRRHTIAVVFITLLLGACSQLPSEIHYGTEECAHCKMIISDPRFAAQMVTDTGKAITFDAIECMAGYAAEQREKSAGARFWVSNFKNPGEWLELGEAHLIRSEVIRSPMGGGLLALPGEKESDAHLAEYPGERVEWDQLSR